MAISYAEISTVRFLAVCCDRTMQTAKVLDEMNTNGLPRRTTVQFSIPDTDLVAKIILQTDTDDNIMPIADRTVSSSIQSAKIGLLYFTRRAL